ncbi:MAG: hypothetical protein QM731_09935 [Chitinophagaceae bacterium]
MKKTQIRKRCLLHLLSVLVYGMAYCQNFNPNNVTNIQPPSPEVAALGKYIDMPVGYSAGTANINVPIYTIKSGSLELPLSLNYHTGGIKVEEAATWTGLGWNLSAGGSVSRTVRGQPDDFNATNGYMYTTKTVKYILGLPRTGAEYQELMYNQANNGSLDIEPDMYVFSAMNYSGKFFYNQDSARFITVPYQRIKIEHHTDNDGLIKGWVFTLPNGVKCYFGISADGQRTAYDQNGSQELTTVAGGNASDGGSPQAGITSWQVTDIVSPSDKTISFYYSTVPATDFGRSGETTNYKGISNCDYVVNGISASYYLQHSTKSVIQKISTDLCDVMFVQSSAYRQDVLGFEKSLDSIMVKDKSDKLISLFGFNYSYSVSDDAPELSGLTTATQVARKRLMLNSFIQYGSGTVTPLSYNFSYNSTFKLPSRLSASQDFWGYYNGKDNGTSLTPKILVRAANPTAYSTSSGYFDGADRTVAIDYARAGSLSKVQYPTGGSTEYFYESNTARNDGVNDQLSGFTLSGLEEQTHFFYKGTQFQQTDPAVYIDSFTISNLASDVLIIPQLTGCASVNAVDCPVQLYITGITDPGFSLHISQNTQFYYQLPAGKYKLQATLDFSNESVTPDFTLSVKWSENPDPDNLIIGGLRIRKIVSNDSVGNKLTKTLVYTDFSNPSFSSGKLVNVPVHRYLTKCGCCTIETTSTIGKVVSSSAIPLATPDGQIVQYANVAEYYDDAQSSFKTEYTMSVYVDGVNAATEDYPYPQNVYRYWRAGLLLDKKEYEIANGNYRVLKNENHSYNSFKRIENQDNYYGIGIAPWFYQGTFGATPYTFGTEWFLEDSVATTTYDYSESTPKTLMSYAKYGFNEQYNISITKTINSKKQVQVSRTWYPYDYSNTAGGNIGTLKDKYMVDVPVKQISSVDGKLTNGTVIAYNGAGLPADIYSYEGNVLADTTAHDGTVLVPSGYNLKTHLDYNAGSNPSGVNTTTGITSYLWDYQQNYPVAAVKNADTASVAYTSFEADNNGKWTIGSTVRESSAAITGVSSYNLSNGAVSKSGLSASLTYWITYWSTSGSANSITGTQSSWPKQLRTVSRGGTTWYCYGHQVTGVTSVSVTGSNIIDELRLYPVDAQMTTYTFTPLIGMSAQVDAAGNIQYYEYDGFNRLLRIRDKDSYILKQYDYQYKQFTSNNAVWQATGNARCKPCGENSSYTTNIRQQEERDNNPGSTTYNQTRWTDAGTSTSCIVSADWQNTGNVQCLTDGNGYRTGVQHVEQRDLNPCSSTYNQLTYQDITNTSVCTLNAPAWQATGNTRCKPCPANSAYITNVSQREEKDNNPNSTTYNQTRWTDLSVSGTCVITADWQNTGNLRCKQADGYNNGEQEREQMDMNPCSSTYGQSNWITIGWNYASCPIPCNSTTCTGISSKCVNGVCETGIKVYISPSVEQPNGTYLCTYRYEWSDGSWSSNYTEYSSTKCTGEAGVDPEP